MKQTTSVTSHNRRYLEKIYKKLPSLDLISLQKDSYNDFLSKGIGELLHEISPIEDFTGKNWELHFLDYHFGKEDANVTDSKNKGLTYEMPLKINTRLVNKKTGEKVEEEVFFGHLPKMTENGTFIINGIERAVVNQLVRSPGVFFSGSIDPNSGRMLNMAELRPLRGSWLEFNVNRYDVITVKVDRHRKFVATTFLRAFGLSSDEDILNAFKDTKIDQKHDFIFLSFAKDTTKSQEEALIEIYEKLRPGEPAILENARNLVQNMFFNNRRYDLGRVGRYKLNKRLGLSETANQNTYVLTLQDLVATLKYLINLQNGQGRVDDIDHLSNRRIRRVGELVAHMAFRPGLLRLERAIKEKMTLAKSDQLVTPAQLINPRPLVATIADFFRRNRLSTILDQTNPLSEVDNLRRLSVMGQGGVTRERASFSMRDINTSQYSRICPVRSPEGPNIGLVTYLSLFARIDEYGFLLAPYKKVAKEKDGKKWKIKIQDEIHYLSADDEEDYYITHAQVTTDEKGYILDKWVPVRYRGEFLEAPIEQVQYIDVVPRQLVGISASLIPFLAHDEANRALMGTHMQCQAVPLVKAASPLIGTGMEESVACSMGRVVYSVAEGEVVFVDANTIKIKVKNPDLKELKTLTIGNELIFFDKGMLTYHIRKFERTSQSTCYSQRPLVSIGDIVKQGQIIIDGPASDNGELALGQNLLIAYTSFEGLGYEDAIIISDRLVKEDVLSSIYINEYEAAVMDTKLGPEELTKDIPNVSETDLANLTDDGIVAIGSNVNPNDILVGKIAPKGETELSAEERLLRAIFGEKAREVRDTSLRMPHGEHGIVIEVRVLDRDKGDELDPGVIRLVKVKVAQLRKVVVGDKLAGRHGNKGVISKIVPQADMPYLADGRPVDIIISPLSVLARMNMGQLFEAHLGWAAQKLNLRYALPVFEKFREQEIEKLLQEAHLPVDGKVQLFDGRTGEPFMTTTVVGIEYILKLIHMVEDKTHARSTGPYSLVTQQPLGGKAQMGGQRLGEMEVWTLEAHQAAYTLQEMLTIKSDDVVGRAKAFEAIVKGLETPESTIPESFKVLVKELNSLGLNIIPGGVVTQTNDDQAAAVTDDQTAGKSLTVTSTKTDDKKLALPEINQKKTQPKAVSAKSTKSAVVVKAGQKKHKK